jgi:aryl-alcohol dehydrogenase-like predicted oxidoreductase
MRYRIFGRTGIRASSLALGTGNFGKGWGYGTEAAEAKAIFDRYRDAGGNFIDTADQYQFGQSEAMLADFIANDRDNLILATKFSLGDTADSGLHRTGNSRKAMSQSVEASLRRLKTDRIDLLWVHMPDAVTPIDEILYGLENLVQAGKILYAGLSDFPAWRAARAATLAEIRGWAGIAAIQVEYSLVERTPERELLPMAAAFGLGVAGWSPLGGGLLTGKYRRGETGRKEGLGVLTHAEDDERKVATVDALLSIAEESGHSPGAVAIAWSMAQGVMPILGPRTEEQLIDNLSAAEIQLTAEHLRQLSDASAISLGFPHDLVGAEANRNLLASGRLDKVDLPAQPVR